MANTSKLDLILINSSDRVAASTFNAILNDADNKLVGIGHVQDKSHWELWKASTNYNKGNIVRITNNSSEQYYLCLKTGISGTVEPHNNIVGSIVPDNTTEWIVSEIGSSGSGSSGGISIFQGGTYYFKGQAVLYNGILYRCINDHNSAVTFIADIALWQQIKANIREWASNAQYFTDDVVVYDRLLFKANKNNTSLLFNHADWDLLGDFTTIPDYVDGNYYRHNQVVLHEHKLLRAKTNINDAVFTDTNWEIIYDSYVLPWVANKSYYADNLCIHDNKLYRCIIANNDANFISSKWQLIHASNIEEYNDNNYEYAVNDVFRLNDRLYCVKKAFITNGSGFVNNVGDIEPLKAVIPTWTGATYYYANDTVVYNKSIYVCVTAHTSDPTTFELTNTITGAVYWYQVGGEVKVEDYDSTKQYNLDDIVAVTEVFNASAYVQNNQYGMGDLVVYNGELYEARPTGTATSAIWVDSEWKHLGKPKTVLYRCIQSPPTTAPSHTSLDWVLIDNLNSVVNYKTMYNTIFN